MSPQSQAVKTLPSNDTTPEALVRRLTFLIHRFGWDINEKDIPLIPENATLKDGVLRFPCPYFPGKHGQSGFLRTVQAFWSALEAPTEYTKQCELSITRTTIRPVAGSLQYAPGIRWVEVNLEAYKGMSPKAALEQATRDGTQLAGVELLMAALLFPAWMYSWLAEKPCLPNMSGIQLFKNGSWANTPFLRLLAKTHHLELEAYWDGLERTPFSSPTVKEC